MSTNTNKEEKNKNRGLVFLLIGIIAALSGLSGYLYTQMNALKAEAGKLKVQQEQANKDIDEYRLQLQELTAKYDSLMQAHEGLRSELSQEREKIGRAHV